MRHQTRQRVRGRRPTRSRHHSRRKPEIDQRGMDEIELAKLQAFEDLNRGFKSAMKMVVPTLIGFGVLVCFYLWLRSF